MNEDLSKTKKRNSGQVLARIQKWHSWTISEKNNLYASVVEWLMDTAEFAAEFFVKIESLHITDI